MDYGWGFERQIPMPYSRTFHRIRDEKRKGYSETKRQQPHIQQLRHFSYEAQYDHIFYSGFPAVSQFGTVTQKWANLAYISDHYPVYAIMRFDK